MAAILAALLLASIFWFPIATFGTIANIEIDKNDDDNWFNTLSNLILHK